MIVYTPSRYYTPEIESDRNASLSPILMRALRARGMVTEEDRQRFLHPSLNALHDPFLLPNMQKAVDRIEEALFKDELICIYGDYDVDGICATAMLLDFLMTIGGKAIYKIPSRQEDGYGMSKAAIDKLHDAGVGLIITVDNGISAYEEISYASELGMDVIVTDHHIPPANIPKCVAVICHSIEGSRYPYRYLCGAGTAFKLIQAMGGMEFAMPYISLAGLATIADVVPLMDENRVFVRYGLDAMNGGECCLGLTMLLESLPSAKKPYSAFNIGFGIAPRLNASGRMSDASLGVELFMTESADRAAKIIEELGRLNELRQAEEQSILDCAISLAEAQDLSRVRAILLTSDEWNSGVIGIAASRISEIYHRPAILFSEKDGVLKGSARSVEGINIHDALKAHADMFVRFGGHAKAAGVTMRKEQYAEFCESFNAYLEEQYSPELFMPRRTYEFDEDVSCINLELAHQLEMLAPFGEGNPIPVFHATGMLPSRIRRFGNDGQHLRMDLRRNRHIFESVYFCGGRNFERIMGADSLSLLYSPFVNQWNGTETVQLRISSAKADMPSCPSRLVKSNMHHFYMALMHGMICGDKCISPPETKEINIVNAVRKSFAGIMVIACSPQGAEVALSKLVQAGVENFEPCFGAIPNANVCSNALLMAPDLCGLPTKGYNTIILCDEPYNAGCIDAIRAKLPAAKLYYTGGRSDFSEVASGFSISRDEFGIYYRKLYGMLSQRTHSISELCMRLSRMLSRPIHQSEFVLRVFAELGFISDDGTAVRLMKTEQKRLDESRLYRTVAEIQQNE